MFVKKVNLKLFRELKLKKNRDKYQLFIAEGEKIILDLFNNGVEPYKIFSTEHLNIGFEQEMVSEKELSRISSQKNPNKAIAIFNIPKKYIDFGKKELMLALDGVNDPGNLGTIIRICNWFGIKNIICSKDTVDCYNIKTVQSSMGSISEVGVFYVDLYDFLKNYEGDIFGTFLDGSSLDKIDEIEEGIIVMGNEANGISKEIESLVTERITIQKCTKSNSIDSLNVAIATGIVLYQVKKSFL